jgi:hypothetical protein
MQLFGDLNILSFVRKVSWIGLAMLINGQEKKSESSF